MVVLQIIRECDGELMWAAAYPDMEAVEVQMAEDGFMDDLAAAYGALRARAQDIGA